MNISEIRFPAREFLTALKEFADVVVWTTRCNPDCGERSGESSVSLRGRVEDWLKRNNMPYDEVFIGMAKPLVAAVIDDRAVPCRPQDDVSAFAAALVHARLLCDGTPLGATGQFPDGRISGDDEGELRCAVGIGSGRVFIDFGKPVTWVALPADHAKEIADALTSCVEKIRVSSDMSAAGQGASGLLLN